MIRVRGFKIGHKFVKIFKWIVRPRKIQSGRSQCPIGIINPVAGICSLACCLSRGAKRLCGGKKNSGQTQIRLSKDSKTSGSMRVVLKGHLVVHVGEFDSEMRRVVVLVVYFNHPLFRELLEKAGRVYGFDQPGRIISPCLVSDFEKVHMKIAVWDQCYRKRTYKKIVKKS